MERDHRNHEAGKEIGKRTPVNFAKRNQKLCVNRLEQGEIKSAGANQFAEFFCVGHEESLNQTVDEPGRRDEQEKLVAIPTAPFTDRVRVLKNDQVESDVHQCPANTADTLKEKVHAERHVPHKTISRKRRKDAPVTWMDGLSGLRQHQVNV